MSHISDQLLPSGSVANNLVVANAAEDGGPVFATLGTNEKDELMQARKNVLLAEFKESTVAISTVARAQRTALEGRIRLLWEIEQADIRVQKLHMERKLQKLREEIYGEVMVPGPIRKLPGEMLGTIFRLHVEDDRSPWILAKVCKAWMHVATRTPQLWCSLFLLHPEGEATRLNNDQIQSYVVNGKIERSLGRMQLCFNKAQVNEALFRSGTVLPLTVKICDHTSQDATRLSPSIFITHPLSERLENLDIGQPALRLEGDISIGRFPLLRSMQLPYGISPCIANLLDSVSITSQALETAIFPGAISPSAVAYPFWARLKSITIRFDIHGVFNQLVDQLSGIECLDISGHGWLDRQIPVSVLVNIQELTLDCFPQYLGRLHLPHLKTLRFISNRQYTGDIIVSDCEQLSYPMVENLVLSTSDPNWHVYTAGAFPAVQNLSLTWLGDDIMPINTLKTMPSVRNVTITGPGSSFTFGILLMEALWSPHEPVLCANLGRLSLGDSVRTPKARLTPWIKKLIQFRNKLGRPLQELTVHWSNEKAIDYAAM